MPSFSVRATEPSEPIFMSPDMASRVYVSRVISLVFTNSLSPFSPSSLTVKLVGSRHSFSNL
jgi:hypothetical protein